VPLAPGKDLLVLLLRSIDRRRLKRVERAMEHRHL